MVKNLQDYYKKESNLYLNRAISIAFLTDHPSLTPIQTLPLIDHAFYYYGEAQLAHNHYQKYKKNT